MTHRHHRLVHHGSISALISSGLFLVIALAVSLQAQLQQVDAGSGVFSQTNIWNARLARATPLAADSTSLVQALAGQLTAATVSTTGPILYTAAAYDPTVTVTPVDCGNGVLSGLAAQWQAVPLPASAQPGANGRLLLYQSSSQTLWEFEGLQQVGGNWQACAGGRIQPTADSTGVYPAPYGLTGSGASFAAGQLTAAEVNGAPINHVLGLTLSTVSGAVSWPARQSNGSAGTIAMGQRFRLDPNLDINSLGLSSFGRAVAQAAQTYGFIVWDQGAPGLVADSSAPLASSLAGFPWNRLQALPLNYAQGGIVPTISSFSQSAATINPGQSITLSWTATNVDSCAVPPYVANLPATGSWQSPALNGDTGFTLVCGGIAGSTSRQAGVHISQTFPTVTPPVLPSGETLALTPVSGLATILPELSSEAAASTVQKVEYFERDLLVGSVTTPPFGLETTKLPDGPHILDMTIYYRDGHSDRQRRTITIANTSQALLFAPVAHHNPLPKTLLSLSGITAALGCMGFAIKRGAGLAHLD